MAERQAWLAKVEAQLAQIEGLLWSIEKKVKTAKERVEFVATSAAAWAVKEYKNSDTFEEDVAKARVETYAIGFNNCKTKVARAHPRLDLSNIVTNGATPEEEGREKGYVSPRTQELLQLRT